MHVHTEFSLLDGAARIDELMKKCKELGMESIAITDHGTMYGVIEFFKSAKRYGIKPIIGCEVYIAKRTIKDKTPNIDDDQYHFILLAENETGYNNLLKITSIGFLEGFYYKPRVDIDVLKKHSDGIIALSACLAGEIPSLIIKGEYEKAKELALTYEKIFGKGNFFLEIQDHGMREEKIVCKELIRMSGETGIPLVATNDVHYIEKHHSNAHDVLLCIQTLKTIDDDDRMKFPNAEFYLKSSEEMKDIFSGVPKAIMNTKKIANRCNVDIEFGELHLPEYNVPNGYNEDTYLKDLCYKGLKAKYKDITPEMEERLEYELKIIKRMDFSSYFLIVWDFIKYAKEKSIIVGPGRGSAAGSLVAYCLEITDIDPLKYNLIFERFLNPERVSMPDIDIDFCYERRQEVIDYVTNKYGHDKVAQIITFGTMAARGAIRDVGRALNYPYSEVDYIAKQIPFEPGMTIEKALTSNPGLKKICDENHRAKNLIDTSKAVEGLPRHASTHAAGVIISKSPLTEYVPLQKANDGSIITQYPMGALEDLGLLKMDFLGLRTLTVIQDTLNAIYHTRGENIDLKNIPLDSPKVYEMLSKGETYGVFQLESSGMQNLLKELKPTVFEEIIAVVGLYRPGPIGSGAAQDFIMSKHGKKKITYLHQMLEPILKETHGIILYQEQAMKIAQELAGFSMAQADILRKAMGKKQHDIMESQREAFVNGCLQNGIKPDTASEIFDMISYFAGYGFNKAHSAAYALIAYQTAYLKAHYPVEFMASLLTSVMDNTDKVSSYINVCRKTGIQVLPPDINESLTDFTVVGDKIRFGLAAVKNVGKNAINAILESRNKNGDFETITDFCSRVNLGDITRKTLESLIKCGAFDSLGFHRSQLLAVYEKVLESAYSNKRNNLDGQIDLFSMIDTEDSKEFREITLPNVKEFNKNRLLAMEKETLGLYITDHPLSQFREEIEKIATLDSRYLTSRDNENPDMVDVIVCGVIHSYQRKTTRRNDIMAFVTLEDLYGMFEVIIFPNMYEKYSNMLLEDNIVVIKGKTSFREEEEGKIICEELIPFETKKEKKLYIQLTKNHDVKTLMEIKELITHYPGNVPIYFLLEGDEKAVKADTTLWVDIEDELINGLTSLVGDVNIKII